jgi:predicted acylesterase/phospholipase RssA
MMLGQIDQTMLDDVAAAYREGRRLFVVTTNLDAHRPVLWNMGSLAASGKPGALELFRKVILASASVPGLFDPVFIDAEANGHHFKEMHVDGGTALDVLAMPLRLAAAGRLALTHGRPGQLYIVINNNLDPTFAITKPKPCRSPPGRSIHSSKVTFTIRFWDLTFCPKTGVPIQSGIHSKQL